MFSGKQKYWLLGACAGILVLASGLCVILFSGADATPSQSAQFIPVESTVAPPTAQPTTLPEAKIVLGTPEVDLVAESRRQEIEAVVIRNVMLPGTMIYGVDVSGLTREEAKAAVEQKLMQDAPGVNLYLSNGTTLYPASGEGIQKLITTPTTLIDDEEDDDAVDPAMKAAEAAAASAEDEEDDATAANDATDDSVGIRLKYNVDNAVYMAFSLMRDKTISYEDFLSQMSEIASGREIAPTPDYDLDSVDQFVAFLASILDSPAVNASITMENNQIVYLNEATGRGIDRIALTDTILNTDPLSGETIPIPIHDLEPSITKDMLQSKYVLRGQYQTNFSDSTKNRKYNIRFGADKINGTILRPGEVFSANNTLGKRTRKNGWKNAGAYEGGEVVQQAGGGVCQLSSTLYNAALYADMEIVERRNHSMPVHYVSRGRDATINSIGNLIDFKFRNNTSSDIIIIAYTEGNNLHMEIYGVPFETDEYDRIEIRTKQTGSTSKKTKYTYDNTKSTSYSKTTKKGSKGYKVKTYKDYYLNDELVKTDDLGLSVYSMFPKEVTVGTKEVESSSSSSSSEDSGGD